MNTYALIDGVKYPNAIKQLYSKPLLLQVIPLYINTPYQEMYDLGAILVAELNGSTLINEVMRNNYHAATIIHSNEYLAVVADHLKQLITIKNPTGNEIIFRFSDPVTTWHWLNSYSNELLADVLAPIQKWQVVRPTPNYTNQKAIIWDEFINPLTDKKGIQINDFGSPQYEALDSAYHYKLKHKMYDLINKLSSSYLDSFSDEQIDSFLEERIRSAKNDNVVTEQGIASWLAISLIYESNFTHDDKGYWQLWLAKNPIIKPLPIDIKLEHFIRQHPELLTTSKELA